MLNVKYTVEIGIEGTPQMRKLANDLSHPEAFKAPRHELVEYVCGYTGLLAGLNVEALKVASVETRDGFQISVNALVKEPEALAQAAINRYNATWPATRAPDPWHPKSAAEALYTLVTYLTPAIESDHSECYWLGMPIFLDDEPAEIIGTPSPT